MSAVACQYNTQQHLIPQHKNVGITSSPCPFTRRNSAILQHIINPRQMSFIYIPLYIYDFISVRIPLILRRVYLSWCIDYFKSHSLSQTIYILFLVRAPSLIHSKVAKQRAGITKVQKASMFQIAERKKSLFSPSAPSRQWPTHPKLGRNFSHFIVQAQRSF